VSTVSESPKHPGQTFGTRNARSPLPMTRMNATMLKAHKPADRSGSPPEDKFVVWSVKSERSILRQSPIVGVLGLLIMIGLFLANHSLNWADWDWCAMFFLFGLVCLGHQLMAGSSHGMTAWTVRLKQTLHWLSLILAVRIMFLQLGKGQMDPDAVALMILLMLSVTCFLAGLHFDRSFIRLSIFLVLCVAFGNGDRSVSMAHCRRQFTGRGANRGGIGGNPASSARGGRLGLN
jgi:hypothetical protein